MIDISGQVKSPGNLRPERGGVDQTLPEAVRLAGRGVSVRSNADDDDGLGVVRSMVPKETEDDMSA